MIFLLRVLVASVSQRLKSCSTLIGIGGQDWPEQAARPNRAALARDPPHSNSAPGEVWSRRLLGVREPPLPPGWIISACARAKWTTLGERRGVLDEVVKFCTSIQT